MRYDYSDLDVVHRVFGSACYITSSFPRWVGVVVVVMVCLCVCVCQGGPPRPPHLLA